MRKKNVGLLILIVFLFSLFPFLFLDTILENKLEAYGSSLNGASVEFDSVHFSFFHSTMQWQHLQVANPKALWQNTFETKDCKLKFEFLPLLQLKFIADDLSIHGLSFTTKRNAKGAVFQQNDNTNENSDAPGSGFPNNISSKLFHKVNTDSLLASIQEKTPGRIDSVKKTYQDSFDRWEKELNKIPDTGELDSLKTELKKLKFKDIKTLDDAKKMLDKLAGIYDKMDETKKIIDGLQREIEPKFGELKDQTKLIEKWTRADYRSLIEQSQTTISTEGFSTLLFGSELTNKIMSTENIVTSIRHFYQKYHIHKPPKESPHRGKGQTIYFGNDTELPKLWIKQIELSGKDTNGREFSGWIKNLTTNQNFVNEATELSVSSSDPGKEGIRIEGKIDYRDTTKTETAHVIITGFPLRGKTLSGSSYLPHRVTNGTADLNVNLEFNRNDEEHSLDFRGSDIAFDPEELNSKELKADLKDIMIQIADALKNIDLQAGFSKAGGRTSLKISSSVDHIIGDLLANKLTGKIDDTQKIIDDRIAANQEKYKKEIDSLTAQFKERVLNPLAARDKKLDENLKLFKDKKSDVSKELIKKQGDKLKDLFH